MIICADASAVSTVDCRLSSVGLGFEVDDGASLGPDANREGHGGTLTFSLARDNLNPNGAGWMNCIGGGGRISSQGLGPHSDKQDIVLHI